MSDSLFHDDDDLNAVQRAARDSVRALGAVQPSAEFSARMRAAFVLGSFAAAGSPSASEEDVVPHAGAARSVRRAGRRARVLTFAPIAVAAVLALVMVFANRGPGWTFAGVGDQEYVWIDGERVSCTDLGPFEAALHPGCKIEVPDGGQLEVLNPGNLLVQVNGGAGITLPPAPGRWFGRGVSSEVSGTGTVRVATVSGFEGAEYRLKTSSTELVVRGTAFTIIHSPRQVCVCVLEGTVSATLPDGTTKSVGPGRRITFADARNEVDHGAMLDSERVALAQLRARADALQSSR